jgi:hypothetical protein
MTKTKLRRLAFMLVAAALCSVFIATHPSSYEIDLPETHAEDHADPSTLAVNVLDLLEVKGRAPRTGYSRDQFGNGWGQYRGCDMRNVILQRDLRDTVLDGCLVLSGVLDDPYTGQIVEFTRGPGTSSAVQIEHVVAVSDAWQKGAQYMDRATRVAFFNDPLNLLAVEGNANQAKGDSDAASWLPPNKAFRCEYISRQIGVKYRYSLWVTPAERDAMERVLRTCPSQRVPQTTLEHFTPEQSAHHPGENEKTATRTIFPILPEISYRNNIFPSRVLEISIRG